MTDDASTTVPAEIVTSDGSSVVGEFLLREVVGTKIEITVTLRFSGMEFTASHHTYWSALRTIREALEARGLLLRCYGASRNVSPSGMQLDMGQGLLAYRFRLGCPASMADAVNIFDTGPDVEPVAVAEQSAFYEAWARSIGAAAAR